MPTNIENVCCSGWTGRRQPTAKVTRLTPSGHLCGIAESMSLLQGGFVASLGGTTLLVGVHATGFFDIAARSRFATSIVPGFVAPPGPGMGLTISAEIASAHAEHVTFGSNRCPQDL